MAQLEPPISRAASRLTANRHTFERLLAVASRHVAHGRHEAAAAWAEIAAAHAWKCHPGVFADDRLERLLAAIGAGSREISYPRRSGRGAGWRPPLSVLHVMTEARPTGGHTRLVWRWIEADRSRRHAVVLTRQQAAPVPDRLLSAPRASGGWVRALNWRRFRPVARAETLRALASEFDLVVLHVHPFDVVPAIAFARGGPPVALLNHAGFAFWVGRDCADVVACLRPSSCALAVQRRGVDPNRCVPLPIPVDPPPQRRSRLAARRALMVPEDAFMLLTVAEPFKYIPFEPGPSFLDLATAVALRDLRVHVLAVGPADEGAWRKAGERTGGRVRAFGVRPDADLFGSAADLYLDSFPVSSPTSFLDASRYGLPIVSFCPHRGRAGVLCADDPSLDGLFVRAETSEAFTAAVGGLVEDGGAREALGRATAEAIVSGHGLEAFAAELEEVYSRAASMREAGEPPEGGEQLAGPLDASLVLMQEAAGISVPLSALVADHFDSFPQGRTRSWMRFRTKIGSVVENGAFAHRGKRQSRTEATMRGVR